MSTHKFTKKQSDDMLATLKWAADTLMCDRDNDDPCTAEAEYVKYIDGDCNPCHVRREIWSTIKEIT